MRTKEARWLLEEKYSGVVTPAYLADLARLKSGEPLAYVIGWVDFLGCRINLDSRPLIPRPETEWWTQQLIERLADDKRGIEVLDLFAGSGCIGIAILSRLPRVRATFGEIVPAHCAQILKNLSQNNIPKSRARVVCTDGYSEIRGTFDLIVANPPYIPEKSETVERSVLEYEPHGALFSASNGMGHIELLLANSHLHLSRQGSLVFEFGAGQETSVRLLAEQYGWKASIYNDQYGIPRYGWFTRAP